MPMYFFIPLKLSHVHKCHGSTQRSQCETSPLTEIFVIVELGALSVLLASRPPTSRISLVMTVHSGVPQTVFNRLCTAVLLLQVVYRGEKKDVIDKEDWTDRVDGST